MRTVAPWHQSQNVLGTLFTAVVLLVMLAILLAVSPFIYGHVIVDRLGRRTLQPVQQEHDVSGERSDRQGDPAP